MENQAQLDSLIKKSLADRAESIHIPDNMTQRVKGRINSDMKKGRLQRLLINAAASGGVGLKQAAAAVILLLFFGTAAAYTFNPHVKAWAEKKASDIINTIRVTISGDGQSYTKSGEMTITDGDGTIMVSMEERGYDSEVSMVEIKDLEKMAGYKVKLPKYLPNGFKIPEKASVEDYSFVVNKNEDNSDYVEVYTPNILRDTMKDIGKIRVPNGYGKQAKIKFSDAQHQFEGLSLAIADFEFLNLYGSQEQRIKISNKAATLFENDLMLENEGGGAVKRVTECILEWKDGNLIYRLVDYTGLEVDELIKIAESIVKES